MESHACRSGGERPRFMPQSLLLVPLSCLTLLTACGGGGTDIQAAQPQAVGTDQVAASDADAAGTAIPASYTLTVIKGPEGVMNGHVGASKVNSKGQVIGSYDFGLFPGDKVAKFGYFYSTAAGFQVLDAENASIQSWPQDINEDGIVVGSTNGFRPDGSTFDSRAFVWSLAGGKTELLSPDASVLSSFADFVSDSGIVAGRRCLAAGCAVFQQDLSTSERRDYRDFKFVNGMNEAGTMLGFFGASDTTSRLATISRDGTVAPLQPELSSADAQPEYIADNGTVFLNALESIGNLKAGAVAVIEGVAQNVGRGIAPSPSGTEQALLTAFNGSGEAVGFDLPDGPGPDARQSFGFFWSAAGGAVPIKIDDQETDPRLINKGGLVAGTRGNRQFEGPPFLWTRNSGVLIEPLIVNLPAGRHLKSVHALSDAGHLVGSLDDDELVLLTPTALCPTPPAATL
jgi:hypothetical protein